MSQAPVVARRDCLRLAASLGAAPLLGAVAAPAWAGGQLEEPLADSVRTALSSAVTGSAPPELRFASTEARMDYLRQGIYLRGYAQKQPKQEYKREAFELFRQLIDQVKTEVTRVLMTVQVRSREEMDEAAVAMNERGAQSLEHMSYASPSETEGMSIEDDVMLAEPLAMPEGVHVGRNDPCPCGSGKKFKLCHGKLS